MLGRSRHSSCAAFGHDLAVGRSSEAAFAFGLDPVQGTIGLCENILRRRSVRDDGAPDRGADPELVRKRTPTECQRIDDPVPGLLETLRGRASVNDRKFIAAKSGNEDRLRDNIRKPARGGRQARVAGLMPQCIVDRLETIQIDQQQPVDRSGGASTHVAEDGFKLGARRKAGHRIDFRQPTDMVEHRLLGHRLAPRAR